ncbi:MAG: stage 0 sporulation protein [Bacilli bacterium]|nr:stage 0 sporulation protein [Bacilli bacterium]
MFENKNPNQENKTYDFDSFVGIQFKSTPRAYFFGTKGLSLEVGDKVVVETVRGMELGEVVIEPIAINKYESPLGLKPVIRKASDVDVKLDDINQRDAVCALEICKSESEKLGLKMNLISCEYTLDKSKVLFSYLADERVDFRELLKVLATRLHTRIELRQIGSRDKAKMIGGIGVCGLPICCSTFLNEFDGISINRAKNQMLAINIPKLSGHCGKLICCLKYEDDAYTEERKKYPELGTKLSLDNVDYTVTSVNILSGMVKIENPEDVKLMPYSDLKKNARFQKPKKDFHEQK